MAREVAGNIWIGLLLAYSPPHFSDIISDASACLYELIQNGARYLNVCFLFQRPGETA